ncbi:MAG: hypothetical protein ACLPZM_04130 [Thermoplasmata archaeon]
MTRILTDYEVAKLIDRRSTVDLMEQGYRADAQGEVVPFPRSRLGASGVTLAWMGAALPKADLLGYRSYLYASTGADRGDQVVALYQYSTMALKALFLGRLVGALRTGASVVAALRLAQPDLRNLGLIGTGNQAREVLSFALAVFPLDTVWAWSPNLQHCNEFREWAMTTLNCEVNIAKDVAQVLSLAPAAVLATSSESTVVTREMTRAPKLLVSISAYRRPEIDLRLLDSSARIWTDSVDQAADKGTLFADPPRRQKLRPLLDKGAGPSVRDRKATRIILNTGAAWEEVLLAESLFRSSEKSNAGAVVELSAGLEAH